MNKQQRLRNVAEGLLAALVAVGFDGPFRWAHHQWEGAFYKAWRDWPPASRNPGHFPRFSVGGSADGRTSQARELLWEVKRTSPFHGYDQQLLTPSPMGLDPKEFLAIRSEGATPQEWMALARAFLAEMNAAD